MKRKANRRTGHAIDLEHSQLHVSPQRRANEYPLSRNSKSLRDCDPGHVCCGCSQRQNGGAVRHVCKVASAGLEKSRAKVVRPLCNAMSFIDDDERYLWRQKHEQTMIRACILPQPVGQIARERRRNLLRIAQATQTKSCIRPCGDRSSLSARAVLSCLRRACSLRNTQGCEKQ